MKNRRNLPFHSTPAAIPVLEELSSALTQLGRLAEMVAARFSRGDSASDWLPQLAERAKRVRAMYAVADERTRNALQDTLSETAEVVRLAASCGEDWLAQNRSAVAAAQCAAKLRKIYGLDAEFTPIT